MRTSRKNPSRISKRLVVLVLVLVGFLVAARLAAYQLDLLGPPWEPFFGDGAVKVLRSAISRALPIPDALLGAIAYALEAALVAFGGRRRWLDRPWIVLAYGAFACVMALTSAVLVVLQPAADHAFCTLCLVSAAISFVVVGPAIAEARASLGQLLAIRRSRSRGTSLGAPGEHPT